MSLCKCVSCTTENPDPKCSSNTAELERERETSPVRGATGKEPFLPPHSPNTRGGGSGVVPRPGCTTEPGSRAARPENDRCGSWGCPGGPPAGQSPGAQEAGGMVGSGGGSRRPCRTPLLRAVLRAGEQPEVPVGVSGQGPARGASPAPETGWGSEQAGGTGRDGPACSRAAPGCREGALLPATRPRAGSAAHLGGLKQDFFILEAAYWSGVLNYSAVYTGHKARGRCVSPDHRPHLDSLNGGKSSEAR